MPSSLYPWIPCVDEVGGVQSGCQTAGANCAMLVCVRRNGYMGAGDENDV
jgi:hypothetical protein